MGALSRGVLGAVILWQRASQHLNPFADDLDRLVLDPSSVLPSPGPQFAFNINAVPFFEVVVGDPCEITPQDHLVPLGPLLRSAISVPQHLRGGDRQRTHGLARFEPPRFRVASEAASERLRELDGVKVLLSLGSELR